MYKDNIDIQTIENNYDNLETLNIISYLLNGIINDIEFMNDSSDFENDLVEYLDLGNNYEIKKEELQSLYSIIDTIYFINQHNGNLHDKCLEIFKDNCQENAEDTISFLKSLLTEKEITEEEYNYINKNWYKLLKEV